MPELKLNPRTLASLDLPAEPKQQIEAGVIPRVALQAELQRGIGAFLRQVRTKPAMQRGRFVGWRVIELFKKQRPGEPPSVDNARALLNQLFFDPKRYDLTRVGRYKLNSRLNLDIDLETRTYRNLTAKNAVAVIPGTNAAETIVLNAHVDGWFDGAGDNADGLAVLVALARHFARPANRPSRTLVLVASAGHHTPGLKDRAAS